MGGSPGRFLQVPDGFRRGEPGFLLLLEKQGGRCAICHVQQGMELVPDHDHLTGRARGLLCAACNHGIGMFSDDQERLREASAYVTAWRLMHVELVIERKKQRRQAYEGVRRRSLYGPDSSSTLTSEHPS